ncbi:hypothetical protein DRP05_09370 [Archaeoglobales archaeon]|nr:MAG: hypothetical protein DRP05_09370 [Archaeoglobales archaeon]
MIRSNSNSKEYLWGEYVFERFKSLKVNAFFGGDFGENVMYELRLTFNGTSSNFLKVLWFV